MTEDVSMTGDREPDIADPNALQSELGEIKSAMGIADSHPYWWRFWIVEGISVGLVFVLVQYWLWWGFDIRLGAAIAIVFGLDYFAKRRIKTAYDPPATGLPSQRRWLAIGFIALAALVVGLIPIFEELGTANSIRLALLAGGVVVGLEFMYMGQLLDAYDIRPADQYAFYVGGVWILVLAVAIPYVSAFRGWEYAVFGLGITVHNVGAYVALARL